MDFVMKKNNILNSLTTFLFYLSILFFFIGFNFQDTGTGGWIQQYLPSSIGRTQIRDITFADSLTGYAVTDLVGYTDTNLVLKTTNGGNNWNIILTRIDGMTSYRIQCLNKDTVFVAAYFSIYRTYNGGINWTIISIPSNTLVEDLFVLNKDTMWYADGEGLAGGLFRTTNGGQSWQSQSLGAPVSNPHKVYFFNARIGFVSAGEQFLKTTNSGANWTILSGENDYTDIYFIDSLRGYKAKTEIKKTTNGGLNWQAQYLPNIQGVLNFNKRLDKFSYNNDTIYGVWGSVTYPNFHIGALVYKTTNGGLNWGYQILDTSFHINVLHFTKFIKGSKGWCYSIPANGIATLVGGDSTIYTGISNINNYISEKFTLNQNYPNPFNSTTLIGYYIQETGWVKLKIFDITGKEMGTLVNEVQGVGGYGVPVSVELSSGVYFYKMTLTTKNGIQMDTKKMMVIK
jgi:photosystem II stability/assembly factor-like uncharacterized protein